MHRLTASGLWAAELVQRTAPLLRGGAQWDSCNTLPHCLGAVGSATPGTLCLSAWGTMGSGTPATHRPTAWGQSTIGLLQYTASLLGVSGQCNSCNTLPHHQGPLGSVTCAINCPTAWGAARSGTLATDPLLALGQWALELLQYTASLPWASGQWESCNTLPHRLGAVGSGSPAVHYLSAWGQREV